MYVASQAEVHLLPYLRIYINMVSRDVGNGCASLYSSRWTCLQGEHMLLLMPDWPSNRMMLIIYL